MRLKHYSTSYGLSIPDLYSNYPIYPGLRQRLTLFGYNGSFKNFCAKVFRCFFKILLLDIINNNTTFLLPSGVRAYIEMNPVSGEKFKEAYQNGAFQDVDFLASNFTGHQIVLRFASRYGYWKKQIHVSKTMKDMITENTNHGKLYG